MATASNDDGNNDGVKNLEIVKKVLIDATDIICNNLDPRPLLRTMKTKGALTEDDLTNIRAKRTSGDMAEELLIILQRKPCESYDIFIETLKATGRADLYKELEKIELKHGYIRRGNDETTSDDKDQGIDQITSRQIMVVIAKLNQDQLRKLFCQLNLTDSEVATCKKHSYSTDDVSQATSVLMYWRDKEPDATVQTVLEALYKLKLMDTYGKLVKEWGLRAATQDSGSSSFRTQKEPKRLRSTRSSYPISGSSHTNQPPATSSSLSLSPTTPRTDMTDTATHSSQHAQQQKEEASRHDSEASSFRTPREPKRLRSTRSSHPSSESSHSNQPPATSASLSLSPTTPGTDITDTATYSSQHAQQQKEEDSLKLGDLGNWKQLGKGAHGEVYNVTFTAAGRFQTGFKGHNEAAVKRVNEDEFGINEIGMLKQLDHPNIIKLLDVIGPKPDSNPPFKKVYYIVMERGDMSLFDYMDDPSKPLTLDIKFKWALSVTKAVEYLHENRVVHRDLKPQNCIIFQGITLKVCDFGLSRDAFSTMNTGGGLGTYVYIAPETDVDNPGNKDRQKTFSNKSDVYQVGCLLWELFARATLLLPPYSQMPEMRADHSTIQSLLNDCLQRDHHKRPLISAVLSGIQSASGDMDNDRR